MRITLSLALVVIFAAVVANAGTLNKREQMLKQTLEEIEEFLEAEKRDRGAGGRRPPPLFALCGKDAICKDLITAAMASNNKEAFVDCIKEQMEICRKAGDCGPEGFPRAVTECITGSKKRDQADHLEFLEAEKRGRGGGGRGGGGRGGPGEPGGKARGQEETEKRQTGFILSRGSKAGYGERRRPPAPLDYCGKDAVCKDLIAKAMASNNKAFVDCIKEQMDICREAGDCLPKVFLAAVTECLLA